VVFLGVRSFANNEHSMETETFTITQIHQDTARFAKAMGHPVRIAILELLNSQACCFHGDMAEILPVAKSTLSQHLKALKEAGLIQGSITPPNVKYCINRENWKIAREMFNKTLTV
jgi:predicted transcriptional regulator